MFKKIFTYFYLFSCLLILSGCSIDLLQSTSQTDDEKTKAPKEIQQEIDHSKLKVHYIDVGQADATFLQFNDTNEAFNILIDTGDWSSSDVVAYLHSQNIKDIDIIAITHPHADHIGQLDKIIKEFNIDEVWMNGETSDSQVFARALEAIEMNEVNYYEPEIGELFDIGPLEIAVLHPNSLTANTNNNSLALRMQYDEVSFLFTGDAEQQAENELLNRGENLQATILHVGHHGSNTSTTSNFLEAVQPEIAIYSAGIDNSYGHPDLEIIHRIKTSGTLLYGTDIHGTIVAETDGKTVSIKTEKQYTQACIDINTATEKEVQQITHIGSSLAIELIKLRPYQSIDELIKINGIGDARLKDIKAQGLACIGG